MFHVKQPLGFRAVSGPGRYSAFTMPGMSLANFIRDNQESILAEWEAFARTCAPGSDGMNVRALRDHATDLLSWIADDLETAQTQRESTEKSRGLAAPKLFESIATKHGNLRFRDQFSLTQVFAEFRALRSSVTRLWTTDRIIANSDQIHDLIRFNEAIDEAVAESVTRYSESVEDLR